MSERIRCIGGDSAPRESQHLDDGRYVQPADGTDLEVRVEFVVIDGPDAAALRTRQTAAIRALLRWITDQQGQTPESGREKRAA